MGFGDAISSGFRNYVNFRDRAPRSEYWYWVLFTVAGGIVAGIVDVLIFGVDGLSVISMLFNLAVIIPSVAVGARRLHDIDRTGWWQLINFTGIGVILLIVWFCRRSDPGPNRFGPMPVDAILPRSA